MVSSIKVLKGEKMTHSATGQISATLYRFLLVVLLIMKSCTFMKGNTKDKHLARSPDLIFSRECEVTISKTYALNDLYNDAGTVKNNGLIAINNSGYGSYGWHPVTSLTG